MTRKEKWIKNYNLAKKYYEEHGDLLIPRNYVVKEIDNKGKEIIIYLGRWINTLRYTYKGKGTAKINAMQIKLLDDIAMVWELQNNEEYISNNWYKNYNFAKKYYEEHGDLLIPHKYEVKDENGNVVHLGCWINTQRTAYKGKNKNQKINQRQINLLNKINMVWNVNYYNYLLEQIELEYYLYQYGLIDERNVLELIDNKILEYKDNEIVKGNAILLQRNKTS